MNRTAACALATLLALLAPALALAEPRDSVVKIHASYRAPDPYRPWSKGRPTEFTGSGVVIPGKRIITNAHVVEFSTEILVESDLLRKRVPARIAAVDYGMDLALLEVDEEALFERHPPAQLDDSLPQERDPVTVFGYPRGGDAMSVTKGVVSRIEFAEYYFDDYGLRLQIDAALNPGNSGGPVFNGERMIGVVFSNIPDAENTGYVIPTEEVLLFLDDAEDGVVQGKPAVPHFMQTLENPALRESLSLPDGVSGVAISLLDPLAGHDMLRRWDVVTHVAGDALDDRGFVRHRDGPLLSAAYAFQRASIAGDVPVTIHREGVEERVSIPPAPRPRWLIPPITSEYPSYVILGPLVFSEATEDFVADLVDHIEWLDYLSSMRSPLIERRFERLTPSNADERLVVVATSAFPHPLMRGYADPFAATLRSVNGAPVTNLASLIRAVRESRGPRLTLEFHDEGREVLVFPRDELLDATDSVLEDNGIRSPVSADLAPLWAD